MQFYFQGRLVASIEREAKIKSDAARDALLSELVEESNKNIKERSDSANQLEKKTKNKKRNWKKNDRQKKEQNKRIIRTITKEDETIGWW